MSKWWIKVKMYKEVNCKFERGICEVNGFLVNENDCMNNNFKKVIIICKLWKEKDLNVFVNFD